MYQGIVVPFNVQYDVPLARYTAARLGGPADALVTARTADELAEIVTQLWQANVPFVILGGGCNVLVSDAGVRGVVVLNRARKIWFGEAADPPQVRADSGANFGVLARQAAGRGLSGLEWAAGIPGTLGGAVVGNAGAHGGDMAGSLLLVEILHRVPRDDFSRPAAAEAATTSRVRSDDFSRPAAAATSGGWTVLREHWPVERMEYGYRSSILKRQPVAQDGILRYIPPAIVLSASLRLSRSTPEAAQATMDEYNEQRHRSQPPGASLGSIFKNPPGDVASLTAGRLIEAAGLKGTRMGGAEISPIHANFFINRGKATASDYYRLIEMARRAVEERFGVRLELEIELVGEWNVMSEE